MLIFIGRDLNKALIRYLENRFVEIARNCKRYIVLTKNTYRNTVMKESQIAVMEEFVDNVKTLINALGYKVMEPLLQTSGDTADVEEERLFIAAGNASATGVVTAEGFVVGNFYKPIFKIPDERLVEIAPNKNDSGVPVILFFFRLIVTEMLNQTLLNIFGLADIYRVRAVILFAEKEIYASENQSNFSL